MNNKQDPANQADEKANHEEKTPIRVRRKKDRKPDASDTETRKKQARKSAPRTKPEPEKKTGTRKPLLPLPWRSARVRKPVRHGPGSEMPGSPHRDSRLQRAHAYAGGDHADVHYSGKDGAFLLKALGQSQGKGKKTPHTHWFHAYPGRTPPGLVHALIQKQSKDSLVFDPFMGSGTVLLEGQLSGMRTAGNDLNPLAGLITRERCRWLSERNARRVWTEVEELRGRMETRALGRKQVQRKHVDWLKTRYPPHLLVEMLHWIDGIDQLPDPAIRETLRTVFSSLVMRFTPSPDAQHRKSNVPRRAFGRAMSERTRELLREQTLLAPLIRLHEPSLITIEDTFTLEPSPELQADCVITRPPLPGSANYFQVQMPQLKWLELPTAGLEKKALGSEEDSLRSRWIPKFRKVMLFLRRSTVSGGRCFLLLEDWLERNSRVDAIEFTRKYAGSEGWSLEGHASRKLPAHVGKAESFGRDGKWEHLLLLRY